MPRKIYATRYSGNDESILKRFQEDNDLVFEYKVVNSTNDSTPKKIIIILKSVAGSFDESGVQAWKTLMFNGSANELKYFNFSGEYTIKAEGISHGIEAVRGKRYQVNQAGTGLELLGNASSVNEYQFKNNTSNNLTVSILKDKNKIETTTVTPNQIKAWQFNTTFWIAAFSTDTDTSGSIEELLPEVNTQINLMGVRSADVVMTGGGAGPSAQPISFSLQNIVYS